MENQPARARLLLAGGALLVLLLLSHHFLFFFRDNFSTHFPVKTISASSFRAGQVPMWNFHAGGGQPLAGNPNTLTFYPDNILYLFLPVHAAFNLHFILHLALGFYFLRDLLVSRGLSNAVSTLAALIYLLSGVSMSSVAFYNLVTGVMLLPMALGAVERLLVLKRTGDAAVLGLSFGLAGLVGEPVLATSIAAACGFVTLGRWSRGFAARLVLAVTIAVVIALPLLIAYSEIAPEVERTRQKFSPESVLAASLRPERFLEMVLGPFLGSLTDQTATGYRAHYPGQWPPLFGSVFAGALLLPALFTRDRAGWREKLMFLVFALLALGRFNPIVAQAIDSLPFLRLVRYPEKFLLPMNAAAALLIGRFLADPMAGRDRFVRAASFVVLIGCVITAFTIAAAPPDTARAATGAAAAAAMLAAAFGLHDESRRRVWMPVLALVPLVLSSPLWGMVDRKDFYVTPSSLAATMKGARIWYAVDENAFDAADNARDEYRRRAFAPGPIFGAVHGLRYAGDPSPEGMFSFFSRIVHERLTTVSFAAKERYLDLLGVTSVVTSEPGTSPRSSASGAYELHHTNFFVSRRSGAVPSSLAYVATGFVPVRSIQQAVAHIEGGLDPSMAIVSATSRPPIDAGCRIVSGSITGQTIHLVIEAEHPALIVVNQTYFRAWTATGKGAALRTLPVNIDRLGVIVPGGASNVTLHFGQRRRAVAVAVVFSVLAVLICATFLFRSRTIVAAPAR